MSEFFKVAAFSLLTLLTFSLYAQFGLPPVIPPRGTAAPPGAAELGRWVYETKGACGVCHNRLLGRAPDLADAAARARAALADPMYKGRATNEREYLLESLVEPSAYVVPGFGRPGTHDHESTMPSALSNQMMLTGEKIESVIGYMLSGMAGAAPAPHGAGGLCDPRMPCLPYASAHRAGSGYRAGPCPFGRRRARPAGS